MVPLQGIDACSFSNLKTTWVQIKAPESVVSAKFLLTTFNVLKTVPELLKIVEYKKNKK